MFMSSLIFVIVCTCGILELGQICVRLLFVSVSPLEINLSKEEGWDTIKQFNKVTFLCLSQATTWISNAIRHGLLFLCSMSRGDRWLFILLILVELLTITV